MEVFNSVINQVKFQCLTCNNYSSEFVLREAQAACVRNNIQWTGTIAQHVVKKFVKQTTNKRS